MLQCAIREIDILILGEVNVNEYELRLYNIEGYDKVHNLGGKEKLRGLVIYTRRVNNIQITIESKNMLSAESIILAIKVNDIQFHVWALYRSPSKDVKKYLDEIMDIDRSIYRNKVYHHLVLFTRHLYTTK